MARAQRIVLVHALLLEVVELALAAALVAERRRIRQLAGVLGLRRLHVVLESADHIAGRLVAGDHVVVAGQAARNTDAQLTRCVPYDVGEVSRLVGEHRVAVVVLLVLLVPGADDVEAGRLEAVAHVDILAILGFRIRRHFVVAGQLVGPALRVLGDRGVQRQRLGAMQLTEGIVGAQYVAAEVLGVDGRDELDFGVVGRGRIDRRGIFVRRVDGRGGTFGRR